SLPEVDEHDGVADHGSPKDLRGPVGVVGFVQVPLAPVHSSHPAAMSRSLRTHSSVHAVYAAVYSWADAAWVTRAAASRICRVRSSMLTVVSMIRVLVRVRCPVRRNPPPGRGCTVRPSR